MEKFILASAVLLLGACGSSGGGGAGTGGAGTGGTGTGGGYGGAAGAGAGGSGGTAGTAGTGGFAGSGGQGGGGGAAATKFKRIGRMAAPGALGSVEVGFGIDAAANCVVFTNNAHAALVGSEDGLGFNSQVYHLDVASGAITRVSVDNSGKPQPGSGKPDSYSQWFSGGSGMRVVTSDCSRVVFTSRAGLEGGPANTTVGYIRDLKSKTTSVASFPDSSSPGIVISHSGAAVFVDYKEGRPNGPPWTAPIELWTSDPTPGNRSWLSWAPPGGAPVSAGATTPQLSDSGAWLLARLIGTTLCNGAPNCVVRREMATGKWDFVATRTDGKPASSSGAARYALAGDGMSLVMSSPDDLLNDGKDTTGKTHVYYIDLVSKGVRVLNQKQDGTFASGVTTVDINGDGRYTVFVADDSLIGLPGGSGLFRYDAKLDKLEALHLDANGKPIVGPGTNPPRPSFLFPRISTDGQRIIVMAKEWPGTSHGLSPTPADDKDTGFYLWEE